MTIRFVERAEEEIDEAIRYYEAQSPGLGEAFRLEIDIAASRIAERPEAWQQIEAGVRRYRLNRFPYGVVYSPVRDDIVVLGLTHLRRRPRSWRARFREKD